MTTHEEGTLTAEQVAELRRTAIGVRAAHVLEDGAILVVARGPLAITDTVLLMPPEVALQAGTSSALLAFTALRKLAGGERVRTRQPEKPQ